MSGPVCDKPVAIDDERELLISIQGDVIPAGPSDDDEWLGSIMIKEDESFSNSSMPKHKIQEVPNMLRQVESNKKCFDPEVVSIGPYHHGKIELKRFEKLKIRLTRDYVKSCMNNVSSAAVLYKKVAEVAGEARDCYAEGSTQGFDDRAFTRMMFLDGCFVIRFMSCVAGYMVAELKMNHDDMAFVMRDLFLLENQLPFKVLQALMSMNLNFVEDRGLRMIEEFITSTRAIPREDSFQEKVDNFITKHITHRKGRRQQPEPLSEDEPVAHLLELVHKQLIHPITFNKGGGGSYYFSNYSVQKLKAAWITFRPNKTTSFLTDVRYEPLFVKAILRLPIITIDDSTQSLLLNLVAYEMCPDSPNDFGVSSYIWFVDTLIDQADDVKELGEKGIILNFLGSDQHVADLFNEMGKNLVPDPQAYENVLNQIEKHYKNKVKLWIASWIDKMMSVVTWTVLAAVAAVIALALSIIQTYYTMHPPPDKCLESICQYLKNNALQKNVGG